MEVSPCVIHAFWKEKSGVFRTFSYYFSILEIKTYSLAKMEKAELHHDKVDLQL